MKRIMFAVDDIKDVVGRRITYGADLVGGPAPYEDDWRHQLPDVTRFTLFGYPPDRASRPSRTRRR
ncbi:hypothetical protein ABZV61_39355 [Streptomyces sp900116325]|uniref:Uncharacterized protein n=1 Tax=Streptomyces sp. 900116325 TaxID=3154295 RepID=A0ABV2ULC8_9ACTN